MAEKTIAGKLAARLEAEGRGFCDPGEPRNSEIITARNYGSSGYLRVHPSGFIQALIQSGALIKVSVTNREATAKSGPDSAGRQDSPDRRRRKSGRIGRRE